MILFKKTSFAAFLLILLVACSCRKCPPLSSHLDENKLLIDDLECDISADYKSGNGAECDVIFVTSKKSPSDVYLGSQAMKITYDKSRGGYIYCARGFGLKPTVKIPQKKLIWAVSPENIDFSKFSAFGFFIKGSGKGNTVAVDIFDKNREIFRYIFVDDSAEWKEVTIPFSEFISREDYQPNWNKRNKTLEFPVLTYQFEPMEGKGFLIIDAVHFAVPGHSS